MTKLPSRIRKKKHFYEEFNERKYRKSLEHAGLSEKSRDRIIKKIQESEADCSTTSSLHNATCREISKISKVLAANYNVKKAIYALGPTGFPFEILCSEMLKAKGFNTTVSVIKKGKFVDHEVDIVAERKDINIYFECKFHAHKYYKNDIQLPLYIHSRHLDIKEGNPSEDFHYGIISNTQFSEDAIKYSVGVGLILYSMNYPKDNNFVDLIQRYKVYPISVLRSLKVSDRNSLFDKKIVVVKQITRECLEDQGIPAANIAKILKEVKILTTPD